jgi:hypothetical protein
LASSSPSKLTTSFDLKFFTTETSTTSTIMSQDFFTVKDYPIGGVLPKEVGKRSRCRMNLSLSLFQWVLFFVGRGDHPVMYMGGLRVPAQSRGLKAFGDGSCGRQVIVIIHPTTT